MNCGYESFHRLCSDIEISCIKWAAEVVYHYLYKIILKNAFSDGPLPRIGSHGYSLDNLKPTYI